jgi:hypothetical protein
MSMQESARLLNSLILISHPNLPIKIGIARVILKNLWRINQIVTMGTKVHLKRGESNYHSRVFKSNQTVFIIRMLSGTVHYVKYFQMKKVAQRFTFMLHAYVPLALSKYKVRSPSKSHIYIYISFVSYLSWIDENEEPEDFRKKTRRGEEGGNRVNNVRGYN